MSATPGGRQLVQIQTNEDASSVRDRLSFFARGQRVLLIWPEEGTALNRKLDLVLIQREAMRRSIKLALVTHDPLVMQHAKELNISTFETIGSSERGRWKRGRARVFTTRRQRPDDQPEPDELMEVASRVRASRPAFGVAQVWAARVAIVAIMIGVVFGVIYVFVPSATVILVPARQIIRETVLVTVNPDPGFTEIDLENAILPARLVRVQVEETAIIPTTGAVDLGNVASSGLVVFINQTTEGVEIPAGTTVSTSAGTPILFRTTQDASLPAGEGQQVEVPIEAMSGSAGDVGNVGATLINTVIGPLEQRVSVRNLAPTSGGISQQQRAVTTGDRNRLLIAVRQQLQDRAYLELVNQATATQTVILETLRIIEERDDWTTFSAQPGEIAETLSVTMRVVVEGAIVDTQPGQSIVFARMAAQAPRGRPIQPETVRYTQGPVNLVDGQITFTISGEAVAEGQIDAGQVRQQVAGRTLAGAMEYLLTRVDLADGTAPQIRLSANLFNRMPILPTRIQVQLELPE